MDQIKKDIKNIDWKIGVITIASTLLLMADYYYKLTAFKYLDRLILYLAIPLFIIIIFFQNNFKDFGLSIGNWRFGIKITIISIIVIAPILWFVVSKSANMKEYYESQVTGLPWNTFIDLIGWEFFFRGFILFGYARKLGPDAVWLQAVPFALAHLGKPDVETLSTIFGGFVFGWIAYRTKSFIYPFLIHWFVASFTILCASSF